MFAFEGADFVFALAQVKAPEFARRIAVLTLIIPRKQRDADRAEAALASAPLRVSANNQFLRPMAKGRMAFSAMILLIIRSPRSQ